MSVGANLVFARIVGGYGGFDKDLLPVLVRGSPVCRADCADWQEKLQRVFGKSQKTIAFVKTPGRGIPGINEKADHPGLFGNESGAVNGFSQQEFAETFAL